MELERTRQRPLNATLTTRVVGGGASAHRLREKGGAVVIRDDVYGL